MKKLLWVVLTVVSLATLSHAQCKLCSVDYCFSTIFDGYYFCQIRDGNICELTGPCSSSPTGTACTQPAVPAKLHPWINSPDVVASVAVYDPIIGKLLRNLQDSLLHDNLPAGNVYFITKTPQGERITAVYDDNNFSFHVNFPNTTKLLTLKTPGEWSLVDMETGQGVKGTYQTINSPDPLKQK